jgi:regulator of sigma E protease
VQTASNAPARFSIGRGEIETNLLVRAERAPDGAWLVGIGAEVERHRFRPLLSLRQGIVSMVGSLYWMKEVLARVVTGEVRFRELSGPVGMVALASRQAKQGLSDFLAFLAVLNVNLGILNLLPIPALDGGHVLFMLIGLGLAPRARRRLLALQARVQIVGFVLLIALILTVSVKDVRELILGAWPGP